MINIAIVDDNIYHAEDLNKLLCDYMLHREFKVEIYETAESFSEAMRTKSYEIVFLDIVLNDKNGIDLGEQLLVYHPETKIIFISTEMSYFKDVYRVPHVYFLTKDYEKVRFEDAMNKVLRIVEKRYITVPVKHENVHLLLKNIVYLEGYAGVTKVYMRDGTASEYRVNIKKMEALLPEEDFIRTHQSFIVNMHRIVKYTRQSLLTEIKTEVPISRAYIQHVREKIALFLGGAI